MDKIRVLIYLGFRLYSRALAHLLADEEDLEVVWECSDSEEAVTKVIELRPDVTIIDVNISNDKGFEVVKRIKEKAPSTGMIVLSQYAHGLHLLPCLRAGVLGYLLKDAAIDELFNAIRSVHAGAEVFASKPTADILHSMASLRGAEDKTGGILHDRELEILRLAAKGMHNKDISAKLHISERTVQTHLANVFRKLRVSSRTEATSYAIKRNWVTLDELS